MANNNTSAHISGFYTIIAALIGVFGVWLGIQWSNPQYNTKPENDPVSTETPVNTATPATTSDKNPSLPEVISSSNGSNRTDNEASSSTLQNTAPSTERNIISSSSLWTGDGNLVRRVPRADNTAFKYYLNRDYFCDKVKKLNTDNIYQDFIRQLEVELAAVGFFEELKIDANTWHQWFEKNNLSDLDKLKTKLLEAVRDYSAEPEIWVTTSSERNVLFSQNLILAYIDLSE